MARNEPREKHRKTILIGLFFVSIPFALFQNELYFSLQTKLFVSDLSSFSLLLTSSKKGLCYTGFPAFNACLCYAGNGKTFFYYKHLFHYVSFSRPLSFVKLFKSFS